MKKLSKVENYQDFINLSPTSDATDIDEYSEILDYSLNNKDIQNIAVFGNYGAGKSSFLKTYFKDKNKKKCLSRLIHIHINMKNTVRTFLFYPGINTRVSKYNKTKLIDIFLKIATFP